MWRKFLSAENLLDIFILLSLFLPLQKFALCSFSSFSVIDEVPGADFQTPNTKAATKKACGVFTDSCGLRIRP